MAEGSSSRSQAQNETDGGGRTARVDSKKPKLVRRRGPKTHNGCITCKVRRVKCDETKPECLRCVRFWGKCEGYSTQKVDHTTKPVVHALQHASKTPKVPLPPLGNKGEVRTSTKSPRYHEVGESGFKSEEEYRFFNVFKGQTAEGLSGVYKDDLWERVVLQACADEGMEFVKMAAIAIGALSTCGRSFVQYPHQENWTVATNYGFALQHYGEAVAKMRKSLSNSNIRQALLGCLLVICFESQQGNYMQALAHRVSGTQLLQNWLFDQSYPDENQEGIASPNRLIVEDELVQAFGRLDLQIMYYLDNRPASDHERLMHIGDATVRNMPHSFRDVEEAQVYCELIQRRSCHFFASTAAQPLRDTKQAPPITNPETGEEAMRFQAESDVFHPRKHIRDLKSTGLLVHAYGQYAGEIARWFDAFIPLHKSIDRGTDERSFIAASCLQIHAKMSEIMLVNSLMGDSISLDRFLPDFRSVVSLAREISRSPSFHVEKFKFDLGIGHPLRLVAKLCVEPVTRRAAIGLLRNTAVREGMHDGIVIAEAQEFLMELEEEGMDEDGNIPEEMRWRYTRINVDCLKGTGEADAERVGRAPDGSKVVRSTCINWRI